MWTVAINGEEPITYQGVLDELNRHQSPRVKSNIKISLCRRNSYQSTDLKEICSRFDQVRPVISHLEVSLPKKPPIPKNIGYALHGNLLHATVQMGFLRLKVLIFINHTVQWHMLTH